MRFMVHEITRRKAYVQDHPTDRTLVLAQFSERSHHQSHGWHTYSRNRFITPEEYCDRIDAEMIKRYGRVLGTPLSQLSGRPGHDGYDAFCRIAESWGYP